MTATFDFDQLLVSVLEANGPQRASSATVEAALTEARGVWQRRPLVRPMDRRAWPASGWSLANPVTARFATVGLVLLLTLALAATALLVGSRLLRRDAPLPGAWTMASPAGAERLEGAAAVLLDGRVLFVGGLGADGETSAPAELYDPRTNSFERTIGQLADPRRLPSVTTMSDGRVLVAGGISPDQNAGPAFSAEIFDPKTGTFKPTGQMISATRWHHTATLLADGQRVLVVGGILWSPAGLEQALQTAEIFDPVAGSWSPAGAMSQPRSDHTATLVRDGRVLVAGGSLNPQMAATTELFDPVARTFTDAAPMTMPRSGHSATALPDGRVLLVGGSGLPTGPSVAGAELYDPTAGRSSATGSMLTERRSPSAALLDDGRVVVAGGENAHGIAHSAEMYDPATGTFQLAASASGGLTGPALRLSDGRVLVDGLQPEVFDPAGSTPIASTPMRSDHAFVPTGEGAQHRSLHTATRLRDGRVLIVGGYGQVDGALHSAEIYDPRTGTSTRTGSLPILGSFHRSETNDPHFAILLHDGRVLVASAQGGRALQIYDPGTGGFTDAGSIPTGRGTFGAPITSVQLASGRIIIFGPIGTGSMAYELDPDQRLATPIGDVYGCTGLYAAEVLTGDQVIVLCQNGNVSAYLYDIGSGKSVRLVVPFFDGPVSMVRLADGRVLFANGFAWTNLSVYDPATNRVVVGGVLPAIPGDPGSRLGAGLSMTLLADGRVLITGGSGAAIWDPATGAPRPVPGPTVARVGQTTTLLDDGRVLVFGGTQWPADRGASHPPEAELFDPGQLP